MRRIVFPCLVLLALFASSAHAQVAAPSGAAAATAGTEVVLRSAGVEPRQVLRYHLDDVHAQSMVMDMSMEMSMDMGFGTQRQLMPTMRMTSAFDEPTFVGDDRLRVGFSMTSFEVLPTAGVDPTVAEAMRQSMAAMSEMSGWLVFDSRGTIHEGDFAMNGVDPTVAQQLSGLTDSIEQMSVPFPEEPVGVGAQWDANMSLEVNGMSIRQTASYTVLERTESTVRVAVTVSQTAQVQTITDPSMPGMVVTLSEFNSTGSGEATMSFDRLVPASSLSLRTLMSMSIDDGAGNTMPMSMTNDITMSIAAGP